MKKKMFLTVVCLVLLTSTKLIAQDWSTIGNTLGTTGIFGSIDNKNINFITHNKVRGRLSNDGLWGFGTKLPLAQVHINSSDSTRNVLQVDMFDSAKLIVNNNGGVSIGKANIAPANGLFVSGKVGIGINIPDSRFQINSNIGEDALKIQIGASTKFYVHNAGGVSIGNLTTPPPNGLYVSGKVGIGTNTPDVQLHVTGGSEVTLAGGGTIVAGPITSENLAIDRDELQARNNGAANTLHLNRKGGNVNLVNGSMVVKDSNGFVGIGTTSPEARLQVTGGTNVSLSSGGTIVAGPFNGNNLAIDNTEIQARNNGNSDTLSLNADGGLVQTGGDLKVPGEIFLGNSTSIIGGNNRVISDGSIVPNFDGGWELGTSLARWLEVWATDGTINTSDERDKSNIRDLNYGIKEIMQLRSIRFNWKSRPENGDKLGLIAQDLQKVLPEVVRDYDYKTNEQTGKTEKVPAERLGVMYADIIPVLIRAIQEQQKEIEELKHSQNHTSTSTTVTTQSDNKIVTLSSASLEQNIPNPLNNTTSIRYDIPVNTKDAVLLITDNSGKKIRQVQLNKTGAGIITVDASTLQSGIYNYTLIVDGKMIETKKMVVAK